MVDTRSVSYSARCLAISIAVLLLEPSSALCEHENNGLSPGWALCRSTNPDERITGCSQVIAALAAETKHNQLSAYINRAGAYQVKGDFTHAIEDYTKALDIEPASAIVLLARGAAFYAKGEIDQAIADYDRAIAKDGKNATIFLARASAWRAKGQKDLSLIHISELTRPY